MMGFPADQGYYFPAEFEPHAATWLSWPHKEASWPGKIHTVYGPYAQFIRQVSEGEEVHVMVKDQPMEDFAKSCLTKEMVDLTRVVFHHFPTNDAWCRDHGPAFLINPTAAAKKVVVNWNYNAWGDKYPPYDLDNLIPQRVADYRNLHCYHPGIVMEGGSVDFNGKGTLLTTTSCLLNPNRNPHLNQSQIEDFLRRYYGVEQILWLGDGIEGDDTDGHVDDITRFVGERTVITVVEDNKRDNNFHPLRENLKLLESFRLIDGSPLSIVELPMPSPVIYEGTRLPASYANFYIANSCVVVPTFRDKKDDLALDIIQQCFPERKVVGVDSLDIIWGLGSFHCLSQQEPSV
ncbi:MAG: agmatine deiminase family protein [Lunatimonas sp.]|nr:agmatine deiminase family protein [Lunatimonas sp.]